MPLSCLQVRALCTYAGQGTEFAANKDVQRRLLQRLLFSNTDGYGIKPSGSLQQASAGDLLFLKGHAYPGNSGRCHASCDSIVSANGCAYPILTQPLCKQEDLMPCRLRCCAQFTTRR